LHCDGQKLICSILAMPFAVLRYHRSRLLLALDLRHRGYVDSALDDWRLLPHLTLILVLLSLSVEENWRADGFGQSVDAVAVVVHSSQRCEIVVAVLLVVHICRIGPPMKRREKTLGCEYSSCDLSWILFLPLEVELGQVEKAEVEEVEPLVDGIGNALVGRAGMDSPVHWGNGNSGSKQVVEVDFPMR
jgi:hypothetical protein